MYQETELYRLAVCVVPEIQAAGHRIVFAESCTAGLLAATLSRVPGVSSCLCGSFVTYRDDSKAKWLKVNQHDLDDPKVTAVSETVAQQMVSGALAMTPEATIALSITGHLGPDSPRELDGVVFIGIGDKSGSDVEVQRLDIRKLSPDPLVCRYLRQKHAAISALNFLQNWLS